MLTMRRQKKKEIMLLFFENEMIVNTHTVSDCVPREEQHAPSNNPNISLLFEESLRLFKLKLFKLCKSDMDENKTNYDNCFSGYFYSNVHEFIQLSLVCHGIGIGIGVTGWGFCVRQIGYFGGLCVVVLDSD